MATPIKIPTVGESITEGTIARWLKKDGERVNADEPIFELETEKASSEVPAPAAGVLRIKEREGAKVAIGAVVGEIDSSGDGAAAKAPPAQQRIAPMAEKSAPPPAVKPGADGRAAAPKPEPAPVAPATLEKPASPPPSLTAIAETARLPSAQDASAKRHASAGARETRQRMSAIRQRIAERLLASQQATASLTTFNEADMTAII